MRAPLTDADILAGIAEVARTHLAWSGPISPDMPLVETFKLDSLRQLTLIIELETRFRVRFDEEDEGSLTSVGDLVRVIASRLAAP